MAVGTVTLRFHGRFIFSEARNAQGTPTGEITVIAPNFDNTEFGTHRPLMTIRHQQLQFRSKDRDHTTQLTTLEPMLRITDPSFTPGSETEGVDPQMLVWDLKGLRLRYEGTGPATLPHNPNGEVLKLVYLEQIRNRAAELHPDALRLDTARTNALVHVTSGAGLSFSGTQVNAEFAGEDEIRAGNPTLVLDPDDPNKLLQKIPAEVVEFTVTYETPSFPQDDPPFLTLTFLNQNEQVQGTVSVRDGAIVAFSDSCAALQAPPDFDLEFSRYYDLLTGRGPDALIPGDVTGLSESVPCYVKSSIAHTV